MEEILIRNALVLPVLDLAVDRYAAWKIWKAKWADYVLLTELNNKPDEYQCALLRYTFTSETRNIYDSLNLSEADSKKMNRVLEALETFARGVVNETMERHTFNNRTQEDGEKFDEYLTEIKLLSKNCNFCNQCYESLLRDRIVGGIKCDITRQKLLLEKDLTLKKAEEICRAS